MRFRCHMHGGYTRRMKKLLILTLTVLVIGCAAETGETVDSETVGQETFGLWRCITDAGQTFPWLCSWDHNTPDDGSDDMGGRDIAVKDDRTDCYRIELMYPPATPECFLSKGNSPMRLEGGASNRHAKLLVRDNYGALDRTVLGWKLSRGTNPKTACPTRTVNTCSL